MTLLTIAFVTVLIQADTVTLEERIDLYEPSTGSYLGSERTLFGLDGRRMRLETTDARGQPTLRFFVMHDSMGREAEAFYFEGESFGREVFTYSNEGRLQTTTYYYEPGVAADRTESERDENGREVRKRYYRADGSQYGAEDVLWDSNGNRLGWDFRYVEREGGTSFRYIYEAFDADGEWERRVRTRDGMPERIEVRSRVIASASAGFPNAARFAPGSVSSERSEVSPSFTRDGKAMVFARYDDDWDAKDPFIAYLDDDGWRVEPLSEIGPVYNLAISPDGRAVIYSTKSDDVRMLFRIRRVGEGWSRPENLSEAYGLVGTYPCLTDEGDLIFFDAEGPSGMGLYIARRAGDGFGPAESLVVPRVGTLFDGYMADRRGPLLVSWCKDDVCESGPDNGIWELRVDGSRVRDWRKLPNLPYAWGVQPVESLGLIVYTDGDDILALPLAVAELDRN